MAAAAAIVSIRRSSTVWANDDLDGIRVRVSIVRSVIAIWRLPAHSPKSALLTIADYYYWVIKTAANQGVGPFKVQ
jgi:hypothetical protein